jgi:ribosomal protein S18 acetylase RimI-like enzyme
MPLVYRHARADELERAEELVALSINDLTERHGFGPIASSRRPQFQLFSLQDDPEGVWVAEDGGEILGMALSWICGDLWFLAELFVAPGQQGRGIGNELMKRTLDHARKAGAANKALITFTFNRVSQGLYIRHGFFPRLPLYMFKGAPERLKERLQGPQLRHLALEETAAHRKSLATIDAQALGVSREKHHRYLIADGAMRGVLFHAGDDCVGYAYISADGHIGPLAVTQRNDLAAAFTTALRLAVDGGSPQVSAFLPGICEAALSLAVASGMQIMLPMVLMSTRDFGDWTCYLPRNPGFM